jgi:NDP-sugar pyrophosphorylase family protein
MLNIVIPMAGKGSRFSEAGYLDPKPLIPVFGRPMIQVVLDNLKPSQEHRFILICQKSHLHTYGLEDFIHINFPGSITIGVDRLTEGAACSVLLAREYINTMDPLMIANCDQYIDIPIDRYLQKMDHPDLDGLVMTMSANDKKWSFVRFDSSGKVIELVEKQVVSKEATVGIYNFKRGADFVWAAEQMISKNLRVGNEFYVAPSYNEMISRGDKLEIFNIGSERQGMYGLGIPEDLEYFLDHHQDPRIKNSKT